MCYIKSEFDGGFIMQISVCKLTPKLLDDWLSYFDKDAFSDNEE